MQLTQQFVQKLAQQFLTQHSNAVDSEAYEQVANSFLSNYVNVQVDSEAYIDLRSDFDYYVEQLA